VRRREVIVLIGGKVSLSFLFYITVMGIRAEESVWFFTTFFGSSAALGKVRPEIWETKTRVDTGKTLAEHLHACGGNPDGLRSGEPYLNKAQIAAFLEVHTSRDPCSKPEKLPVGIVTGIRGNWLVSVSQWKGALQQGRAANNRRGTGSL
jgi:N-carbamoyl-L-amino-acid hydrolase